jgi:muramoyltetrapeptide carboxypeptidase LdcA involved in peptidoglycan recycling
MRLVFPPPLRAGSRIVVTAPSSGVEPPLHPRLALCLANLRAQGFVVEEGRCLRTEAKSASAPADERAAELMHTLLRDDVHAVVPPWGGELAIELLGRLDWAALAQAKPKWVLGYSDTSTWMLPLTLRLGWATAHGPCLMDLVAGQRDALSAGVLPALGTATGGSFTQWQSSHWQKQWTDFAQVPDCTYALTEPTRWWALHGEPEVAFSGRLIGGCIDTLMHTAGTAHGDLAAFAHRHQGDGVVLYVENSGLSPTDWVRALHRLRWAGWLDGLAGVLIGRSAGRDTTGATELRWADALASTLGALTCPVLADVDIGHVPPQLLLINGARASVRWSAAEGGSITQTLA